MRNKAKRLIPGLVFLIFSLLLVFFLGRREMKKDTIEVYDKNNSKILQITKQNELKYVTNLLSDINNDSKVVDVPSDAKVSYIYVVKTEESSGEVKSVVFKVFENYPYILVNLPNPVKSIAFDLPKEDVVKLNNPRKLNK